MRDKRNRENDRNPELNADIPPVAGPEVNARVQIEVEDGHGGKQRCAPAYLKNYICYRITREKADDFLPMMKIEQTDYRQKGCPFLPKEQFIGPTSHGGRSYLTSIHNGARTAKRELSALRTR